MQKHCQWCSFSFSYVAETARTCLKPSVAQTLSNTRTRTKCCIRIKLSIISISGIKWMFSPSTWTHSSLCSCRQVGNSVCHIKTPTDSWESTHVPAVEIYDWLHPDLHVSPELSGLVSDLWGYIGPQPAVCCYGLTVRYSHCPVLYCNLYRYKR